MKPSPGGNCMWKSAAKRFRKWAHWVIGIAHCLAVVGAANASIGISSTDALGTTRFLTRSDQGTHATVNGSLGELTTQTFNYDAFGQLVGGNPTDTEYAFTGEEWDSHVGAYYLRARWYRPDWGRFLSRDTYVSAELKTG